MDRRHLHKHQGFTLIEMLLVILIIGLLAGAVVTSVAGRSKEARVTRAQSDIRSSLSLALDMFEHDLGRYPTNSEGLGALMTDPGVTNWKGPYLKSGLKPDPWGNNYVYQLDATTGQPIVRSNGPDGQAGTADDVVQ